MQSSPVVPEALARRSASRLRDEGVTVAANYAGNEERAREFTERTGIKTYKWDVADLDACAAGVAQIESELGPVDILVNNAGITRDGTMKRMDRTAWDDVIDVNLGGCFNMAKAVWNGMNERKYGRIVNIGSINGQAGQYGQVNYAAAKSGIHGFTKALAQEGARAGITVNAIAPGYIDTDMVAAVPPDVLEKIVAKIPVGRLGQASEIARGVTFLCSEDGGFITGSTLSINGGQHMYLTASDGTGETLDHDRGARDLDQPRAGLLGGAARRGGGGRAAAQRAGRADRRGAGRRALARQSGERHPGLAVRTEGRGMSVELNHTIIWCSDKRRSAEFMTGILGLPPARAFLHFLVVDLANKVSVDFYQKEGAIAPQHYAFLRQRRRVRRRLRPDRGAGRDLLGRSGADQAQTRSTPIMAAAASISRTRTGTCSRSSPRPTATARLASVPAAPAPGSRSGRASGRW